MDSESIASGTSAAPALDPRFSAQTEPEPWKADWKQTFAQRCLPTLRYLLKTESHTFAFSVAANAILSFFPFIFLLMWLVRNVFHSQAMLQVVDQLVRDHLPVAQGFVVRNLGAILDRAGHKIQIASIIMLLISSSGVFLPLEVAFNRIWGFPKNRSYLGNQLVSLLLAFACGTLALISVALAVGNESALSFILQGHADFVVKVIAFVALKAFAICASIAIFFLIYWILPNGRVASRSVLPAAVAMGLLWELAKYAYMVVLPWLNFPEIYGPFYISVTLMFWAFISGLIVLAGAHLAAGSFGSYLRTGSFGSDLSTGSGLEAAKTQEASGA
ncbi:MAG TPA: YihY/virulence factor BrkB family protein [Candidatus Angelobacter sp.]|jgi:YihY family inner membrane protein|nr:YihY/virulence factor BrkB family protein [Candidatus Angelobacter sp.]